jgi:magnesium-transporting ATPase (P-type)
MSYDLRLVAMKERLAFTIGTAVVLVGMALVASGAAQLQTGPGWEIPAAAATNWVLFGLLSIVLYGVGIICYLRGNQFRSLSTRSRKIFWILLCVGLLMTVLSYVLDPGQWQITHRNLSAAVRKSSVPIWAICGITWILLTVRSWRNVSLDVQRANPEMGRRGSAP